MALIEFICDKCGYTFEDLVKSGEKVKCPKCGAFVTQKYSGKLYCSKSKASGGCTGNCSTCGGCGH